MTGLIQALSSLSPDTQLVLALTVFALVIVLAVSPGANAKRNICDFVRAIGRIVHPDRKPPSQP